MLICQAVLHKSMMAFPFYFVLFEAYMKSFLIFFVLIVSSIQSVYARPKNLSLRTVKERTETLDVGTPGPSLGDLSVNYGNIYDDKTNKLIGSYLARRMIVMIDSVTGEDRRDNFVEFTLPKGKVYVHGFSSVINPNLHVPAASGENPIVGGTGIYVGVRGRSIVNPIDAAAGVISNKLKFK